LVLNSLRKREKWLEEFKGEDKEWKRRGLKIKLLEKKGRA